MANLLPPLGFGQTVQQANDDLFQTDLASLMRDIYPQGIPQPPVAPQPGPDIRLGRFKLPGGRLDSAAAAVLGALEGMPRERGFGGGLIQGLAGGLAGGRARGMEQRQTEFERQQKAAEEARGERSRAALTLRKWQLDERARKQRELEDTVPNTPEARTALEKLGVGVAGPEFIPRIPRSEFRRDKPIARERDPEVAALTRMQIEEKLAKQEAEESAYQQTVEEVAAFRQTPSSVLKGARGVDAMHLRNRLIADVNKRLRESGSGLDFAKLEALERERDNFYKTQNNQRFTALRQASVTVAKHLKQLEDFYADYRKEFENRLKGASVLNPGEMRALNSGMLAAAENGLLGPEAAERASALRGTSAAVAREASLVFSSGFAPLDQDIAEARHNISAAIGPRGHKGQVKALRALLKARINTAIQGLPFAGGKKNPYLLEASPVEGWEEGESEAAATRPPSRDPDEERKRLEGKYQR